ncbi:MAG: class I SAM-dependent methyltransferase [Acidobacteria bacterium]|nr:class I SAM-dependent methyltransferase [Acidobacteriota bacterium]
MKKMIRHMLGFIFLEKVFNKTFFFNILAEQLANSETILELGAGKNSYLDKLQKPFIITAIDIDRSSLDIAAENNVYDYYIKGDVTKLPSLVAPKSFDAVVAFDLIEHLTKADGRRLIEDMCHIALEKVIIYTPNGFLHQPASKDNPFQEHRSGWDFAEMKQLGFQVYGINGYRKLRGNYAVPRIKPQVLGLFISNLSWLFLAITGRDKSAFSILCIKDVNNARETHETHEKTRK